jgi:hypothetical protein
MGCLQGGQEFKPIHDSLLCFPQILHQQLKQAWGTTLTGDIARSPEVPDETTVPRRAISLYPASDVYPLSAGGPGLTLHTYDMLNKSATMEPPHIARVFRG